MPDLRRPGRPHCSPACSPWQHFVPGPEQLLRRCDTPLLQAAGRRAIELAEVHGWSPAALVGVTVPPAPTPEILPAIDCGGAATIAHLFEAATKADRDAPSSPTRPRSPIRPTG